MAKFIDATSVQQKGTERIFHPKCWAQYKYTFMTRQNSDEAKANEPFGEASERVGKCYWCRARIR